MRGIKILSNKQWNAAEAQIAAEFTAPRGSIFDVTLSKSQRPLHPVLVNVPHSGAHYADRFLRLTRLPRSRLRSVEDTDVDKLVGPLSAQNIWMLSANFPRTYVDINRGADELPFYDGADADIRARVSAGLGVIPTHVSAHEPIYYGPVPGSVIAARLRRFYHPYHAQLRSMLAKIYGRHGSAILIDCHSMSGTGRGGLQRADFILGDDFGRSCAPATIDAIEHALTSRGYSVTRNTPFAGGYITRTYHDRPRAIETVQIEINKNLYLTPGLRRTARFARVSRDLCVAIMQIRSSAMQLDAAQ